MVGAQGIPGRAYCQKWAGSLKLHRWCPPVLCSEVQASEVPGGAAGESRGVGCAPHQAVNLQVLPVNSTRYCRGVFTLYTLTEE